MVQKTLTNLEKFKLFIEPWGKVATNIVITFVQAGVAVWLASGLSTDNVTIGAVTGAGLSAVWNIIIKPFLVQHGYLKG